MEAVESASASWQEVLAEASCGVYSKWGIDGTTGGMLNTEVLAKVIEVFDDSISGIGSTATIVTIAVQSFSQSELMSKFDSCLELSKRESRIAVLFKLAFQYSWTRAGTEYTLRLMKGKGVSQLAHFAASGVKSESGRRVSFALTGVSQDPLPVLPPIGTELPKPKPPGYPKPLRAEKLVYKELPEREPGKRNYEERLAVARHNMMVAHALYQKEKEERRHEAK